MNKPQNKFKVWMTAVRPFAYSASMTAVFLGTAIAFYNGVPIHWLRFFLTLIGVVCFHTAANLLNDRYDFERGLDKQVLPMSGAVVRGWLTPAQVTRAAVGLLILGAILGLTLFWQTGWPVLALGGLGTLIVLAYTRSGMCLKYAALGDAAIFLAFGVLPVFGAFWIQTEMFHFLPILWSLPLAAYTVAILHANNWHDLETDPNKGCRTVASLLGDKRSAIYYKVLVLGPLALIVSVLMSGLIIQQIHLGPYALGLCLLILPKIIQLVRINKNSDPQKFMMLDGLTAQAQMGFGLLLTAAFVIGRFLPSVI
ncbi:prenyltransferase [candidate division KSB1 bacterium]|nr:prenyltransferase [candidate division KSB1 bacterium]